MEYSSLVKGQRVIWEDPSKQFTGIYSVHSTYGLTEEDKWGPDDLVFLTGPREAEAYRKEIVVLKP